MPIPSETMPLRQRDHFHFHWVVSTDANHIPSNKQILKQNNSNNIMLIKYFLMNQRPSAGSIPRRALLLSLYSMFAQRCFRCFRSCSMSIEFRMPSLNSKSLSLKGLWRTSMLVNAHARSKNGSKQFWSSFHVVAKTDHNSFSRPKYSLFQNVAKIFQNVAKIFHNVAKIFHNYDKIDSTSMTSDPTSPEVIEND